MKNNTRTSPRSLFKALAFAEGVTWTLLILGLIARAAFAAPQPVITAVGGLHGAVFLTYAVIAALVGVNQRWGFWRIVLGVALAIVPFATIPFEKSVESTGWLEGDWRRERTNDPRDNSWIDGLFRWFIKRPALLVIVMVVVVATIFAALLIIGPPGGWPKSTAVK
jgi:integral membrane protein